VIVSIDNTLDTCYPRSDTCFISVHPRSGTHEVGVLWLDVLAFCG
jgi:hypothetical protein